jgi:hypothetical protein
VDLADFDFAFHMLGEVCYLHVATGTGILAMDGGGKSRSGDLIAVTAKAGGRVDGHSLFSRCRPGEGTDHHKDGDYSDKNLQHATPPDKNSDALSAEKV